MRPVRLLASLLAAASLSACGSPAPDKAVSATAAPDTPAAAQHWEPAPVLGPLPAHPRNSTVFTAPGSP